MKYKGTRIVVKDCNRALKFYRDMFGLQLLQDNDGNMELTDHLYLQELGYWEDFTKKPSFHTAISLNYISKNPISKDL